MTLQVKALKEIVVNGNKLTALCNVPLPVLKVELCHNGKKVDIDINRIALPDQTPAYTREKLGEAVNQSVTSKDVQAHAQALVSMLSPVHGETQINVYHATYNPADMKVEPKPMLTHSMTVGNLLAKLAGDLTVEPTCHNYAIKVSQPKGSKASKSQLPTITDLSNLFG